MSRSLRVAAIVACALFAPCSLIAPAHAQGTVIATDNFNRGDETPFSPTGNWARTVAGNYDGYSLLAGNQVHSASNEGIYYWQGPGTFDNARQFARERVVQKDGEQGLVLLGGADQAIMVGWGPPGVGSTVYIYWYSNGLDRGQLATGPSTLNNGDVIEAVLDGGVIYAKVNGVTVLSVANSTTLTSGKPGFITYLNPGLPGEVSIVDDWEAGTPDAPPPPSGSSADDFNRANESPLAVGGDWAQPFGGGHADLVGQQVAGIAGEALYYWQGGTFDNTRQFARLRVVDAGGQVGLVLLGAANQALVVAWHNGTLFIYWYSGGSYQGNLSTFPSTLANGDEIEAVLEGGIVSAKINGSVVASVANTTTLTSGRPGFETFQGGAILDDWEAGTPGSLSISGTITESAVGLSGVLVTASGGASGNTTADGAGHYSISGIAPGATNVVITPTLFGHTMSPLSRTVVGPIAADVTDQDFTSTQDAGPPPGLIAFDDFDRANESPFA